MMAASGLPVPPPPPPRMGWVQNLRFSYIFMEPAKTHGIYTVLTSSASETVVFAAFCNTTLYTTTLIVLLLQKQQQLLLLLPLLRTTTYYYVLLRTTTYYYVLRIRTTTYFVYVLLRTTYTYYVLLRTTTYHYVPLRTTTYYYVLRTTTYYYVLRTTYYYILRTTTYYVYVLRICTTYTRWSGPSCAGLVTYNLVILVTRALLISKVTKVITLVISSVTRNQFSKNLPFRTHTFFGLQKAIFFVQFCCVCESELFFGAPFF